MIKVKKVKLDLKATKVIKGSGVTKEIRAKLVRLVIKVRGATRAKKECLEVLESQESKGRKV